MTIRGNALRSGTKTWRSWPSSTTGPGLSLRGGPGPIERGKKMGKGRPTGIKRQDFTHAGPGVTYVTFEWEQVAVLNYDPNSNPEILELGRGGPDLRLYGYFDVV